MSHLSPNLTRVPAAVVVALAVLVAVVAGAAAPAATQVDSGAPSATISGDGRTVSGAGKSLTVSQAVGLAADGLAISVSGSGYDPAKGVYISLCVIPPVGQVPSPCGGGADRENTSGASAWVSSDPPDYATGLSQPYGPGGRFTVQLSISSTISAGLDCRQVACAVVSRNDHTRGSDRSQDLLVPVTFVEPTTPAEVPPHEPSAPTTTDTTPPPPPTTTTTTTLPPTAFAPDTTTSDGGRTVGDGTRTLSVSAIDDLDPAGADLTVDGTGFDPNAGIYVALCRQPTADSSPEPCTAGAGASAWLSSSPPDYGADLAEPFGTDGAFSVTLTVPAVVDADTDCRVVACALTTRRDDTAPADRTSDLFIPVTFAEESPAPTTASTSASIDLEPRELAAASDGGSGDDGSSGPPWPGIVLALVAVVGVGATVSVARRRGSTT